MKKTFLTNSTLFAPLVFLLLYIFVFVGGYIIGKSRFDAHYCYKFWELEQSDTIEQTLMQRTYTAPNFK